MASWQFDFRLLPLVGVERRYGAVPTTISSEQADDGDFWMGQLMSSGLRSMISQFLPQLCTWHPGVERWGQEDGNRIEIVTEKDAIIDFFVRVDVREISFSFLVSLFQIARQHDWLVRTGDGKVMRPSVSKLLYAIHASQAFRFVQDPADFLALLGRTRDCEEET